MLSMDLCQLQLQQLNVGFSSFDTMGPLGGSGSSERWKKSMKLLNCHCKDVSLFTHHLDEFPLHLSQVKYSKGTKSNFSI